MINKTILCGRLGADAEFRECTGKQPVVRFSVATDQVAGGTKYTEWHDICWFSPSEKATAYMRDRLKKGVVVAVEGQTRTDKWEKDGVKHSRKVVYADSGHPVVAVSSQDNTSRGQAAPVISDQEAFGDLEDWGDGQ